MIFVASLLSGSLTAQTADDLRLRGLESAAKGDSERAYELLAPWVELYPEDVEAASALAVVAAETGRIGEAEALLTSLPGDDPRLALLGADLALQRGEARVAILRLTGHWPDHPPALDRDFRRILGQAYVETGQTEEALQILGTVEGDPELVLSLSRALFQSGRMENAVEVLRPFVEQIRRLGFENAPTSQRFLMGEILIDYARGLVAIDQPDEAVAVLEASVVDMASRRGWKMLAQALVAAGRGDEARRTLNRGAALTGKEP